ncbi:MAG: C39 family peptidase, partial [Anaerolineae bacterium]|nr:C39 family peptidase [Anaerolineae bacterium]
PPPRFLLWLVVGVFLLVVLGGVGVVVVFRNVLLPGQQQRVIDQLPFMRALMPPTPQGGTLPTAEPVNSDISPEDLLAAPLSLPTMTTVPTQAPTEAAALIQIEPSSTPTDLPSPTATQIPTSTPTEVPATDQAASIDRSQTIAISQNDVARPLLPSSARMFGFTFAKQTWNNCGPANLTMALSYYGCQHDQTYAAQLLKPDREDKNVSPWEMVKFVNEQSDLRAITRMGGDMDLLKRFIAAQIPILIETGYMPEGYDWIGHYQTVVAYDDLQDVVYLYDTYLGSGASGEGLTESYTDLDRNWQHFNRTFIVLYEPNREAEVRDILGDRADPAQAAEAALEVARDEARTNPRDVFAWFNIGSSLTRMGRYDEAAVAYDQARREGTLPWRMTWYQFGPFEAYFNTGRYDDVLALVNVNLTNGAQYVEETYYWQGRVLEARGDIAGARQAFSKALQHNYLYTDARTALDSLNA